MAPTRNRNAYDDPRAEASSTKDKTASSSSNKARRNPTSALAAGSSSSNKHASSNHANTSTSAQATEAAGIAWTKESVKTLHTYRSAHRIDVPLAFQSDYNNAVLTMPGIGAQSPTMARKKDKRKVSKDQAALAVRKHFNSQAVSETDVVVEFLYKVRNQDQGFKMRFSPRTAR